MKNEIGISKALVEMYAKLYEIQKLSREALAISFHIEVPDSALNDALEDIDTAIGQHLSEFEMN